MEVRTINCITIPHSRKAGHSAVKAAAYRAGENLRETARDPDAPDQHHRYMNRAGDVAENFILTPEGAPDWAKDRQSLWNRVEQIETGKAARVSRDIQLGLAYELTPQERKDLVIAFAEREVIARGFIADVAIHNYGRLVPVMGNNAKDRAQVQGWVDRNIPFLSEADAKGRDDEHVVEIYRRGQFAGFKHYQPHAHVLITCRHIEDGDFYTKDKKSCKYFNHPKTAKEWRYEWPKMQNAVLEANGIDVRVSATGKHEDAEPKAKFEGQSPDKRVWEIEQRIAREDEKARADFVEEMATIGGQATPNEIAAVKSGKVDPHMRELHEEAKQTDQLRTSFAKVENRAIADAHADMRERIENQKTGHNKTRIAVWWRNASQSMTHWPEQLKDHARALWNRAIHGQSRNDPDR